MSVKHPTEHSDDLFNQKTSAVRKAIVVLSVTEKIYILAHTDINLTGEAYHYALEGDYQVQWKLNITDSLEYSNVYVVELWLINSIALQNHSVCAKLISTDNTSEGSVVFPCGCFFAPGRYQLVAKESASKNVSHYLVGATMIRADNTLNITIA